MILCFEGEKSGRISAIFFSFSFLFQAWNICNIAFQNLQKVKLCSFLFYFDVKLFMQKNIFSCCCLKIKKNCKELVLFQKIPGKKDFQLRKPILLNDFSSWCVVTRLCGCNNGNSFSVLLKWLSILQLFAHFFFLNDVIKTIQLE